MSLKKIGILTASRTNNNGTDLQAAAMFYIFSKICKDKAHLEIIDYKNKNLEKMNRLFRRFSFKDIAKIPYRLFMIIVHQKFREAMWKKSKIKYNSNNFSLIDDNYIGVVVGSDQIWNLDITGGDINFFLYPLTKVKKYSFSPSFGVEDLSVFEKEFNISKLLSSFECISVREEININSLKHIGIESIHVLDPIILAGKVFLNSIACKKIKKNFVLLYLIEDNDEALQFAKIYASKHKISILSVGEPRHKRQGIYNKSFVSINKWLSFVRDAKIVVTNSYHGVSTALSFGKQIKYFKLKNETSNVRVNSLCNSLGISLDSKIDYNSVNLQIEEKRKKSYNYAENIIEGILNEKNN